MIQYHLSDKIKAFTTTKNYGRDADALCSALGVPATRFARPHQVHGTTVQTLAEDDFQHPELLSPYSTLLEGVDAVIYNVRNACIGISTADCIPVLCYDPEHHCAAAIHAGWRGTVQRIVQVAIKKMADTYGTQASLLRCAIGPGISLQSFEVGDEVYEAFATAGFNIEDISQRMEKWHINLKHCNEQQLIDIGVMPENIIVSDIDTMTDNRFYSARREGASTGRILSGIVLL